nr:MAG TPA: hypothetical protein [Caudoviricetes sp.]
MENNTIQAVLATDEMIGSASAGRTVGNKKQYSTKELLELGKQKNHIEIAKQLRIKSN